MDADAERVAGGVAEAFEQNVFRARAAEPKGTKASIPDDAPAQAGSAAVDSLQAVYSAPERAVADSVRDCSVVLMVDDQRELEPHRDD